MGMPTWSSLVLAVSFGSAIFIPVSAGELPSHSDQIPRAVLGAQGIATTSPIVLAECSQKEEASCQQEARGCMKVCDGAASSQRPNCIQSCRNRYRQCKSECDDNP